MVVLQTILILIIVYYLAKFLLKWLAPRLLNFAVQRAEERFEQQFGSYRNTANPLRDEGETTIHTAPKRTSRASKKVGEYIDFEEIE